ncbi:hypothetical protein BI364_07930 [Acidihalobacter yilgarnensis]|uniref:diguanylate cyclase n=2 Tax=Acidihalobacter yilgarnensis TaxID=2819280 RepID=A0A1D8INA4_9GAMM|nr:hypothetical protein BI364_07930 [Acidihalobacter yilgarnensis]
MTQTDHEAVERELARLKAMYRESLRDALIELDQLASQLIHDEGGRDVMSALQSRLHRLSGSAGTFGLPALSEAAHVLEVLVNEWLNTEPTPVVSAHVLDEFAADIGGLASLLLENDRPACAADASPPGTLVAQAVSRQVWVLCADDALRQELMGALNQFDYQVMGFQTPGEVNNQQLPDALVVDIRLSGLGEDAQWLSKFTGPLITLVDSMDFDDCLSAAWLGADAVFQHPTDASELATRIDSMLRERDIQAYRVLIVDDDLILAEHYRLVLTAAGMRAEILDAPTLIIERVASFRPELILLDVNLSGYSGPDLASVIRYHDEWVGLPIVYLSAETDLDRQIDALSRGADDFLVKPISDTQLVAVVKVRARRFRQLAELMYLDSLTGLYKHGPIKDELRAELGRARRNQASLTAAMIDIDHFKQVNDTYGHAQGDRVIKALAYLLKQRLRQSDRIGRYGGEEFLVIMSACDAEEARRALDDIRLRFSALQFHHEGKVFNCTLSAGVADNAVLDDEPQALLAAADEALYAAKRSGRDRVVLAHASRD